MILRTKGKAHRIESFIVAKATRFKHKAENNPHYFLLVDSAVIYSKDYSGNYPIATTGDIESQFQYNCLFNVKEITHIAEDDILYIGTDGNLRTLFRVNSNHNFLLVTERCNSNCLMCSQPPKDRDDIEYLHSIHKKLIPLIPKDCLELGVTGGEPTILGKSFFELLELIKQELPNTEIHILTNGRSFSMDIMAQKLAEINNPRIMLGIPLYSDYYQIHDYVVQAKDAYFQTLMGIHNLKRYNIRVEIRVVLHKITIERLEKLSMFIYKNLPFIDHVAFMGLEITGSTRANLTKLWTDPLYYQNQLEKAVSFLVKRKIHTSIYNIPLCLLPENIWEFSRKSISDWKNEFLEECNVCDFQKECGGVFATSGKKQSKNIKALKRASVCT